LPGSTYQNLDSDVESDADGVVTLYTADTGLTGGQGGIILPEPCLLIWCFSWPVFPGGFFPFDPDVATGYDYLISSGPNWATVEFPNFAWGDNLYDLTWSGGTVSDIPGGTTFDLTTLDASGLSAFTVTGVDFGDVGAGEFVDPTNSVAFVTTFSFMGAGTTSFSMTPITQFVDPSAPPIPEPGTWVLLGAGLIGLGLRQWRVKASGKR
ncbi:MAG: PEP-CTERM sorting domain-containing protein, partial [Anaerolineales bacterium]